MWYMNRLAAQWNSPNRSEMIHAKSRRPIAFWVSALGQDETSRVRSWICCDTRPSSAMSMHSQRTKRANQTIWRFWLKICA